MAIQWKDAYNIGNAEIDRQHQEIFEKANAFLAVMDIAALSEYAISFFQDTRDHFLAEEDLMRGLNYPAIDRHIQQHIELLERLNRIAAKIGDEEMNHHELELFLADFVLDHVLTYDIKLATYVSGETQAHAPVVEGELSSQFGA